jgi:hypothetical protein
MTTPSARRCWRGDVYSAFGPLPHVVHLGEVARHIATWMRAPAILGMKVPVCTLKEVASSAGSNPAGGQLLPAQTLVPSKAA